MKLIAGNAMHTVALKYLTLVKELHGIAERIPGNTPMRQPLHLFKFFMRPPDCFPIAVKVPNPGVPALLTSKPFFKTVLGAELMSRLEPPYHRANFLGIFCGYP